MSWYSVGAVLATNGSTAVVGTGTKFVSNVRVGDGFRGPDGAWYEVVNVASETSLGITPAYAGPTTESEAYSIAPIQGYVKESADRLRDITVSVSDVDAKVAIAVNSAAAAQTSATNSANSATASSNSASASQSSNEQSYNHSVNSANSAAAASVSKNDAAASAVNSSTSAANSNTSAMVAQAAADSIGELAESGNLPAILNENAHYQCDGDSLDGWDAYVSTSLVQNVGYISINKTSAVGASAGAYVPITNPKGTGDIIMYGKSACSDGSVIWMLNTSGFKQAAIWFGSANADSVITPGAISIKGYGVDGSDTVVRVPGVFNYGSVMEYALHIDTKYNTLNFWYKQDNEWVFGARVGCQRFPLSHVGVAFGENAVGGAQIDIRHLLVCYPNIVVWGDSIASGATGFDPDPAAGWTNSRSLWYTSAGVYQMLRNNLPINKGVGGRSSTVMLSAMGEIISQGMRVVFMHASSNDYGAGVSQSLRTSNIQAMIDQLNSIGVQVVLLNAMPGTSTHVSNGAGGMRDYCHLWWSSQSHKMRGVGQLFNTYLAIKGDDGYQNAAYTVADGIHPNPEGFKLIGQRFRVFFSQGVRGVVAQQHSAKLDALSKVSWQANQVLVVTSPTAVAGKSASPYMQSMWTATTGSDARAHIGALGAGSYGIGGPSLQASVAGVVYNASKPSGLYGYADNATTPTPYVNVLESVWGPDPNYMTQLVMSTLTKDVWFRSCNIATSATEPHVRLYSSANSVGAVTSSMLTSGLMELVTTAAGTYMKYANGQLFNIVTTVGYTIDTAVAKVWPHPFLSSSTPFVSENVVPNDGWDMQTSSYGDYSSGVFISKGMTSVNNTVVLIGIGRWK